MLYPSKLCDNNEWEEITMKKTLALLISCTMIFSSSCVLYAKSQTHNPKARGFSISHYCKVNKKAPKIKSFDINRDGKINAKDMKALDKAFNTSYKDKKFNSAADLNNDKVINMSDRMLLMKYFHDHNIPIPAMPPINTTFPTPTTSPSPAVINYDINGDGSIDAMDLEVIDSLFNTLSGDPNFNPAADLNGDGAINMPDRMLLMAYLSNNNIPLPTTPPVNTTSPTPTTSPSPAAINYDINGDGSIDAMDLEVIDSLFNTLSGDPNFNPAADLNGDGAINMPDRMLLMAYLSNNNIPSTNATSPTLTSNPASAVINYDINGDGSIDAMDLEVIDSLFNTLSGDPNFNPAADLNGDGAINMPDRMLLMAYLSENNIPVPTVPPINTTSPTPISSPSPAVINYDINGDGSIDAMDIEVIDNSFNTLSGDPNFNPAADLNGDGAINMSDRMLLMAYLSQNNIPIPTMPPINTTYPTPTPSPSPAVINYDINGDGSIDAMDLEVIDSLFNTLSGDPNFNPAADLNGDGAINMPDRMLLMAYLSNNNIPVPTVPPIN
jgi:hypothetical protein